MLKKMRKKPITKKEANEIKKQLRAALCEGIKAAERNDVFNCASCGYTIAHLLSELRKGLHPKKD